MWLWNIPLQSCPAKDANCFRCNRRGHFSSQCLSNTIANITATPGQPISEHIQHRYLDTVGNANGNVLELHVKSGQYLKWTQEETWDTLNQPEPLQPLNTILCGPDRTRLIMLGKTFHTITHKETHCTQPVYVVKNITNNLLGFPAIKALKLVCHVQSVNFTVSIIVHNTFANECNINLKPNAQLFALSTPRNIPLPLKPKVQEELVCMENLGVIFHASELTSWCAAMLVVPKASGAARICLDMKPLNENVLRENHPMPKVDTTLAQLTGATISTIFSKLDANSGFWQIPLAPESKL